MLAAAAATWGAAAPLLRHACPELRLAPGPGDKQMLRRGLSEGGFQQVLANPRPNASKGYQVRGVPVAQSGATEPRTKTCPSASGRSRLLGATILKVGAEWWLLRLTTLLCNVTAVAGAEAACLICAPAD